jgi:hypothetical protein
MRWQTSAKSLQRVRAQALPGGSEQRATPNFILGEQVRLRSFVASTASFAHINAPETKAYPSEKAS